MRDFLKGCVRGGAAATAAICAASIITGVGVPPIVFAGVVVLAVGLIGRPIFEDITLCKALEKEKIPAPGEAKKELSEEEKISLAKEESNIRNAVFINTLIEMSTDVVSNAIDGFAFGAFCLGVLSVPQMTAKSITIGTKVADIHTAVDNFTPTGGIIESTEEADKTKHSNFFKRCAFEFKKNPQRFIDKVIEQVPGLKEVSSKLNNPNTRREFDEKITSLILEGGDLTYLLSFYNATDSFEHILPSLAIGNNKKFSIAKEKWDILLELSPEEKFVSCSLHSLANQFEANPKKLLARLNPPPSQSFLESLTTNNILSIKSNIRKGYSLQKIVAAMQNPNLKIGPQVNAPNDFAPIAKEWAILLDESSDEDNEVANLTSGNTHVSIAKAAIIPATAPDELLYEPSDDEVANSTSKKTFIPIVEAAIIPATTPTGRTPVAHLVMNSSPKNDKQKTSLKIKTQNFREKLINVTIKTTTALINYSKSWVKEKIAIIKPSPNKNEEKIGPLKQVNSPHNIPDARPMLRKTPSAISRTKKSKDIIDRGAELNDKLYSNFNPLSVEEKSFITLEFQEVLNEYLRDLPPDN
jgi:hypothetical protein